MKTVIRTFALALVVAGAAASSMTSSKAVAQNPSVNAMSAMPVPTCPLHDPKGCGIDKL